MKPHGSLIVCCIIFLTLFGADAKVWGYNGLTDVTTLTIQDQEVVQDSTQVVFDWIVQAQQYRRHAKPDSAALMLDAAESYLARNPHENLSYMLFTERGFLYRELGQYDEAIQSFRSIFQIISENDVHRNAVVHNSIATLLRETGEFIAAIEYHEHSLYFRNQVESGGELGLAASYLNYARTFDDLNRYNQSLQMYERAMHYAAAVNHQRLSMEIMVSFGNALTHLGNNDAAKLYYLQGLEIASELNETWVSAVIYTALGRVHLNLGEDERAKENYESSFNLVQGISLPWIVRIYLQYLDFLLETGDTETAAVVAGQLEGFIDGLGSALEKADFTAHKAYLKYLKGDFVLAARYFSHADISYAKMDPYRVNPRFYFRKAFNLMAISDEAGIISARQALAYLDTYRLGLAMTGGMRAEFFSGLSRYVSELALVHLRRGEAEQAFEIAEQLKSRAFTEDLNFANVLQEALVESDRENDFSALQSRIIFLENQVLEAEDQPSRDALNLEIEQERIRVEGLFAQLAARNPAIRELIAPPIISLHQARAALDRGSAGLHIISGTHATGFLLFSRSGYEVAVSPLGHEELTDEITQLREALITKLPLNELNPLLEQATHDLFPEEIREALVSFDSIQISVDGVWAYLPVSALRYNGAYLVESHLIYFTPSFTARALLKERYQNNSNATQKALVFANPKLAGAEHTLQSRNMLREAQSLRQLPFGELEGRWVNTFFPGVVELKSGEEASDYALLSTELSPFSLIHFAVHGIMDERNPRYSGLVLSASVNDLNNPALSANGFLRESVINGLRLNADIVVLSACNTGIGKIMSGEGVLGLQRAFLNAGSSQVAVTLWSVEDRSTSLLMRSFYQNLNLQDAARSRFFRRSEALNYPLALREAQLSMLDNPQYNHPVNWASFVITGK
ncbi:CHAT domain-containing protein [Cyclonatronum proteinivorum]|uniref:CHAT domain-containing protein n=1 Tax=Cyclonatronum proteinivorum TaxID=1457365 RepID=A0A345UGC9_9BACT|nr:CHAT domain-containing tetratricopeptide repeat protein [Cyclonatronum proteinivorum]AXI99530.1 CHAT domain-containing protein [Cyclonatronum proteinivorum]